jgi:hypothetical protein
MQGCVKKNNGAVGGCRWEWSDDGTLPGIGG